MDYYPKKTMEEINQLERKSDLIKELIRKEFPVQFKHFLKGKLGRDYLNLFDLLESYFAVINNALQLEKEGENWSRLHKELEKENIELRKIKQEGDLYELIEKVRANGGEATISITLPDCSSK